VGIAEVLIQTLLAFAAIFLYARLLGKQQVAHLSVFEYITGITFGSIAATLAVQRGPGETVYHFLGLTVFFLLTYMMNHFMVLSRPARKLMLGEPTIVIYQGKILENNMKLMNYTLDELMMQLREKGYFDPAKVEYAILETNGGLSVLPKSQYRPVTPLDLNLLTPAEGMATEIIVDGQVIYQNLVQLNRDDTWLLEELRKQGIKDLNQVAFAWVSSDGILHVDQVKDELGPRPLDPTDIPEAPSLSRGKSK